MADKSVFGSNDEYEKNNISNYDAYRKACQTYIRKLKNWNFLI